MNAEALAALRWRMVYEAIRKIHFAYRPAHFDEFLTCAGCNIGMDLVKWPCKTIEAVEAAIAAADERTRQERAAAKGTT